MQDLLATELPKLQAFKKAIDKAIADRFDGSPRKLAAYGLSKNDTEIALLLKDVMQTKGKRIRAYLLSEWYRARGGINTQECTNACILIEALHTATLIIDDVQDRSGLRRGEPTFHAVYGEAVAISIGLQLLYGASHAAHGLPNGENIQRHIIKFINELAIGQAKDVLWHQNAALITTNEQFEQMCVEKTSKLFILTIRIAEEMAGHSIQHKAIKAVRARVSAVEQYFPDTEQQAEDILAIIGVVYQLADDIANITIDIGKDFGEDIRERKITSPILAAYKNGGPGVRKHLMTLYRKRTISDGDTRHAIKLLIASGAVTSVEKRIAQLLEDCCDRLIECELKQREQDLLSALALLAAKRS